MLPKNTWLREEMQQKLQKKKKGPKIEENESKTNSFILIEAPLKYYQILLAFGTGYSKGEKRVKGEWQK